VAGVAWEIRMQGSGKTRTGGAPIMELELIGPGRTEQRFVVGVSLDSVPDQDLVDMIRDLPPL